MAEKHFKYAPSPSAILRSKGTVVEDSYHFVQNGELVLTDGRKVPCDFEVGYMQDASAWAVVYVAFPEDTPLHDRDDLENRVSRCSDELTGIESIWGRTVKVKPLLRNYLTSPPGMPEGVRVVFLVERYEISFAEQSASTNRFFDLVNLPVHFSHSPRLSVEFDRADAAERAFSVGVDAAINAALEASAEKTPDEIRELALKMAETAKKDAVHGYLKQWFIPIKIEDDVFARLFWKRDSGEIGYPLEPMSFLKLYTDKIPRGWELETVAEWLCALFSMALGRDIQWIHWTAPSPERELPPSREVWRARNVQRNRFTAFALEPYDAAYALSAGLHEKDEWALKFVGTVLGGLMRRDMAQIVPYLVTLRSYISHAATPAPSIEFTCTLLSVLGEYIYKIWTEVEQKAYALSRDQKTARNSIKRAVKTALSNLPPDATFNPFVPPKPTEPATEHQRRRKKFKDDMISKFSKSIGYSLTDELLWFFEYHRYPADYYRLGERIKSFVDSRNALAHEHRFACERDGKPNEIDKEIANIRMMIPLMFAAILRYEGDYWDSYLGDWTPAPYKP